MIIDVRTKGEYEEGHIKDAKLFDIMEMMNGHFPDVPKNENIIVYCESGNRSMIAKSMMENNGFTNIADGGSIQNMVSCGYTLA
ncbi:MAG: rhodanese-like domain-containing protein [Patescibacteria group bacterium]|nr:rhodanese-like domain-containing protein [Patescibacteria group bacterium]